MSAVGAVVWVTGLPSSGKSTLARSAAATLRGLGRPVAVLDGDEVRQALVPQPGYAGSERADFYATLGNLALLLAAQGLVVLVPATANQRQFRERVRERAPRFVEVWVDTPPEVCVQRDSKGLYAASGSGDVSALPGVGADYEQPCQPEVVASGGRDRAALARIVELVSG